jgi:hypothetical protein
MKSFPRFCFMALLFVSICFISGCAYFTESQSHVTDQEHWQVVHDSLYDSFWVDDHGDPKSH